MLKEKFCTTPLLLPSERTEPPVVPVKKPSFGRVFWIAGRLFRLLLDFARDKASGDRERGIRARRVREFLEGLGGMWIKLGQVLAMRTDLFSIEFCRELSRLHDRAMTFSPELSMQIVEEELGRPIYEVFEEFEPVPFAAASLSQAHMARRRDHPGRVVVKVQRPYVAEYFKYDFKWLNLVFNAIGRFPSLRHYQLGEMLQEIRLMMEEEVDYRNEASNMIRLRKTLARHPVYVPTVYLDLCTGRVLVMEFIDGVFVSDYNRVLRDDPARVEVWLKENKIDPPTVATRLFQSTMRQLFEDLSFHGDLHVGNIILLQENNLALIDFGNVGRLDPKFSFQYDQYFRAMADGALDRAADLLLVTMDRLPAVDIVRLKSRLIRVLDRQTVRSSIKNLPYHEKSIANSSAELGQVLSEFKIDVNWQYLRMSRAFETMDQNISILNPRFDFVAEIQDYTKTKIERNKCKELGRPFRLYHRMNDLYELLEPVLTRKALRFEKPVSLESRLVAMAFRGAALVFWLVLTLGAWAYLYQRHSFLVAGFHAEANQLTRWIVFFPYLPGFVWFALAAVTFAAIVGASRFASSVLKPPLNVPSD
jgi:ubiquinone biosynthesis protein